MTVIESFDPYTDNMDATWTGDNIWVDVSGVGDTTITSSTSNVTQGTNNWRVQTGTFSVASLQSGTSYDLSSYETLSYDYFVATAPANRYFSISVTDGESEILNSTSMGATSGTLSLDLTTAGFSLEDVAISISCIDEGFVGVLDIYIDNLQGTSGGGGFQAAWAKNANTVIS